MKVLLLIFAFTSIALIDIPGILRKKLWGELAIFSILLVIGFTLSLLQVIGVKLPNPNRSIESLINWCFHKIVRRIL